MQEKSISKLLKQAAYLHRMNKSTSAHLSINSLLRHPYFSTLCTIAESLEESLNTEKASKRKAFSTKASRVANFRKRILANDEVNTPVETTEDEIYEIIPDDVSEETNDEGDNEESLEVSEEDTGNDIVEDIDTLIDQEIQEKVSESRRILSRRNKIKAPTKRIKLSRATIEANKKAIR